MQGTAGAPLVATKLFVPRLRPDRVERARLRERLDRGRHTVLVSAPAGSGKSTLLADWVAASGERTAWISLEPADDDPRRFLEYLLAALRRVEAGIWTDPEDYARAAMPEVAQALLTEMLNGIAASAHPVTLILDDYHVVTSRKVHDLVQFMLQHLPHNLRVIVSTRSDPPLPLSRLRAKDQLTEIRAADLRFSVDEVRRFLNDSMGLHLADGDVRELERRTEGWAVGLQMAGIWLQGRGGTSGFVESFTGSNRYIIDYLTEEVLASQSEDVREFLLETSILERLSAPLCDAVRGRDDSERILEQLDASNLFLIALDDVRYWYRYHHLFATLLQHQMKRSLGADRVRELHGRASDWFATNGAADGAMVHAVAAGDYERAYAIVAANALVLLLRGDSATVQRWLAMFPAGEVERRVDLLVNRAAANMLELQMDSLERDITRAESLVEEHTPVQHRAAVLTVRAMMLRSNQRVSEAIALYEQAYAMLQPGTTWHSILSFELGMGVMATGDLVRAEEALAYSRRDSGVPHTSMTRILAQSTTAGARLLRGHPEEALQLATEALRWTEQWDPDDRTGRPMSAVAHAAAADVYREWNELAKAREHAQRAVECGKKGFRIGYYEGAKAMLRIAEAENDWEDVERWHSDVLRRMTATLNLNWSQTIEWLFARVQLRRGQRTGNRADLEAVAEKVEKAGYLQAPYRVREKTLPSFFATDAWVIAARVLVQQKRDAMPLLDELLAYSKERDCLHTVIEVLIVRALAESSVAVLQEAMELAAAPRFLRLFVDEGAAIAPLIERAAPRIRDRDFATQLLSAFDVKRPALADDALSEREVEVLGLIAAGASNQEAADKLFISPRTVKKHLENIYMKLGVGGRVQAIARAREMKVL